MLQGLFGQGQSMFNTLQCLREALLRARVRVSHLLAIPRRVCLLRVPRGRVVLSPVVLRVLRACHRAVRAGLRVPLACHQVRTLCQAHRLRSFHKNVEYTLRMHYLPTTLVALSLLLVIM